MAKRELQIEYNDQKGSVWVGKQLMKDIVENTGIKTYLDETFKILI
jgi:hypothetical protein